MLDYTNSKLVIETSKVEPGKVAWRSPSNLALIKYWGKHGRQLPRNPSISFTLDHAYTETALSFYPKKGADHGIELSFYFNDQPNEAFATRIKGFLESIVTIFPFLRQLQLVIKSSNSFPHSAGIASSASSMSALALCLCSLEEQFFGTLQDDKEFRKKASFVARLGSGSASRSIFESMAIWGENSIVESASDLFAIPYNEGIHEVFTTFKDAILIVSESEKAVSSSVGHQLMEANIFAENRYTQARQRFQTILEGLKEGDVDLVGRITEGEALSLHALMMTSTPPYILMRPNSLAIIESVIAFRNDTKLPVYFSLDAGPNIHLLYPAYIQEQVESYIQSDLLPFCKDNRWLQDKVGLGPIQL